MLAIIACAVIAVTMLGTLLRNAMLAKYLFGVEYSPKDLRLALVDAAGGKIGNAVDQVLLFCYQYDPKSGRYSASILNVVRLAGLVTVIALGAFMLTAGRRRGRPEGPAGASSSD